MSSLPESLPPNEHGNTCTTGEMSTLGPDSLDTDSPLPLSLARHKLCPGTGSTEPFYLGETVAASAGELTSMQAAPVDDCLDKDGCLMELSKTHLFGWSVTELEDIIAEEGYPIRRVAPDLMFVPTAVWEKHISGKRADASHLASRYPRGKLA